MNHFFCAFRIDGRAIGKTELFTQVARLPRSTEWQTATSGPFLAMMPQRPAMRPLLARGRGYVGVGDVRLDNRRELLAAAQQDDDGQSDLDVLCAALDRNGADIIPRVLGDFCFVYWDARAQKIVAARDAFGVKPLYYRREGEYLLIGSRLSALVGDESLDQDYLADMLVGLPSAAPRTVWKGTLAVEPGALLVQRGSVTAQSRYWDARGFEPGAPITEADATAEFRRLLFEAVDQRVTGGSSPVWAQLSGGLDSSALVATAERHTNQLAGTVTVVDSLGDGDETTYTGAVLARFPLRNETVRDFWPWRNDLGDRPPLTDEPTPLFPFFARDQRLVDIVRQGGARVLLSGLGSDHYLSGSLSYMADLVAGGSVRAAMREALGWAIATRRSFWTTAHHNALLPLLRQSGLRRRPTRVPRFLAAGFAGAHGVQQRLAEASLPAARFGKLHSTQTASELSRLSHWVQRGPFEDQLEMRYPFLHRPLVEFALTLPVPMKVRPGTQKWILRESMRNLLPEKVRTRTTKGGMDARILWTLQHEAGLMRALLDDPLLGQMGCINVDELRRMVESARQGEYHNTVYLFSVLSLETWLRVRFGMWRMPHAAQTAA